MVNYTTRIPERCSGSIKYFLVDFDDNWAYEMDIRGFCIMSEKQMELYFDAFNEIINDNGQYIFHLGPNKEIEYESIEDFKKAFSWHEITADDKKRMEFLFGLQSFIGDDPDIGPISDNKLTEDGPTSYGFFPWHWDD
jgi:hypothetical protein